MDRNGHDGHGFGQSPSAPSATKPRRTKQTVQAARLQGFAFDAAMSLRAACTDKETGTVTMTPQTATAIYRLIGGWDRAADRLRVLRGRGLPASVKTKPRMPPSIEPLTPA